MRIDVLSVLPRMVEEAFREGVVGRAARRGLLELRVWSLRDFAEGEYRQTDDAPFGGGAGMVMKPEPIFRGVQAIREDGEGEPLKALLSPQGRLFDQRTAERLSRTPRLLLICGRYEGVDERVSALCADEEISIGDYVLSGGEIPAMAVVDAVGRLLPGVLGNADSAARESFADGLLDHPHYTRPAEFAGIRAPDALLSGDHEAVRLWRRREALRRTRERRGDLFERAELSDEDSRLLESSRSGARGGVYLALIHHPVLDRQGAVVTSSVTSLDLHDLARVGRTYGASGVFVIHPSAPQRAFVERVIGHFVEGQGRALRPQRGETLEFLEVLPSLDALVEAVERKEGARPRLAATTARRVPRAAGYGGLREEIKKTADPLVILFGTGWGLAEEALERADLVLPPVRAEADTGFNHLSVRGAAAIVVDRVLGERRA